MWTRKPFPRQLELVRNFFKQQYDSHVQIENDNVDTHGIEYGLKKLHPGKEINAAVHVEICNGCCFNVVFFKALCDKIKATGEGGNPVKSQNTIKDALMVVSDIQQKLELYHAHRVHVANQQKAIYKIEEEMKQECLHNNIRSKHALVVIDWKMKYESMSARETSQEHFGKRETQDGKRGIDANIARSMAHLVSIMHTPHSNKIQRIKTARELAAALAWGGGLKNSFVQLVGLDRPKLANLALIIAPVVEKMKTYFSRLNDIFFLERIGARISAALYDIEVVRQTAIAFKMREFANSGIGSGIVFDCNIQEQSFAPTQVDQESVLENVDGSDETEDNEDLDVAPKTLPAVEQYMFYGPVNDSPSKW
ncbi:hypothetical protein EMCRGX_G008711 [Ephydatia muelleri]